MTSGALMVGLFCSLGACVVTLLVAVLLAHKHRPRGHILGVALFLILFLVTVAFAEMLGRRYEFEHVSRPIHLTLAIVTALSVVAPLWTGYLHWRGRLRRELHHRVALVWFAGVVLSLLTGAWMLSEGTPRPEVPPAASSGR